MEKEWFEWSIEEIQLDLEKQRYIFKQMLNRLETDGHCRGVFHKLAFILFQDDME